MDKRFFRCSRRPSFFAKISRFFEIYEKSKRIREEGVIFVILVRPVRFINSSLILVDIITVNWIPVILQTLEASRESNNDPYSRRSRKAIVFKTCISGAIY